MATNLYPPRLNRNTDRDQLEKQLFKDVQRLIRYLDGRRHKHSGDPALAENYERMILERCEVLGEISRRPI